jgi:hypothetical protein
MIIMGLAQLNINQLSHKLSSQKVFSVSDMDKAIQCWIIYFFSIIYVFFTKFTAVSAVAIQSR